MLLRVGFFCLCLCLALPAYGETYVPVTWPDLLHTMIRFNSLDVTNDNNLLDEYAAVTDCDLYQFYYHDDFKWNQVRGVIRKSIEEKTPDYPAHYHFDARLQLDRYDFDNKLYRLSEKNLISKITLITIFDFAGPICGDLHAQYLPLKYRAKINKELNVPGLALNSKNAENLLNYMNASGNDNHYIYVRFNMTVIYIEPFRKIISAPGLHQGEVIYTQSSNMGQVIVMDVRVDSVDFFEDPEMKKLVYTFKAT